ncbi:hypothetical protein NL676_006397 [Syzygium grande]|nr:hypothetical protein NL676_006397 [Syzygium grande]
MEPRPSGARVRRFSPPPTSGGAVMPIPRRVLSSATVVLKPSLSFEGLPAKYAVHVDESGICGALEVADPADACSALRGGGGGGVRSNGTGSVRFALIVRGNCSFQDKIVNAQTAGFGAAIVYDDREEAELMYMMVNPKEVMIPAVFVSNEAGRSLKEHTQVGTGECCIYGSNVETGWTVLATSLISLILIFCNFPTSPSILLEVVPSTIGKFVPSVLRITKMERSLKPFLANTNFIQPVWSLG